MTGFDPEAEAVAAAKNAPEPPAIVIEGDRIGECPDCGERFEYGRSTGIQNLDPCPECGSQEWTKWGYRYDGSDVPIDQVDWGGASS